MPSSSPTISLINTYFNNPNNNNNIYEYQGTPTWKTCSDNLCTETPYTGTCNKANNNNKALLSFKLENEMLHNNGKWNQLRIYEYSSGTPTWKTCSDNLCTETPYIGTCNPVDTTDPKLGVDCPGLNWIICGITYFNNYYLIGGQRNEASCQLCDKGTFNDIQGQSSCKQCDR